MKYTLSSSIHEVQPQAHERGTIEELEWRLLPVDDPSVTPEWHRVTMIRRTD